MLVDLEVVWTVKLGGFQVYVLGNEETASLHYRGKLGDQVG